MKSFYCKKVTSHGFLPETITQIEQDSFDTTDIVMVGSLPEGLDSDIEKEKWRGFECLYVNDLRNKVAAEVEVFQYDVNDKANGYYFDNNVELAPKVKKPKRRKNNQILL